MNKIIKPRNLLIENTAAELAAAWFEAGLNTPEMNMLRHKYNNDPRKFAQMNVEKFLPTAIKTLMTMLQPTSNCTPEMREEIYDELIDRANEKGELLSNELLPDINVKQLLEASLTQEEKDRDRLSQVLRPTNEQATALKNMKPIKAQRH